MSRQGGTRKAKGRRVIIGCTGHRPNKLGGYSSDISRRLEALAHSWLSVVMPDEVISGMALGWDQAVAWAAYRLGIPFRAYIPFDGQESKWPPAARNAYEQLLWLAQATKVCTNGGYSPQAMQIRNMDVTDDSDMLLALWDGVKYGGTWNCIDYATNGSAISTPIINLWDMWQISS